MAALAPNAVVFYANENYCRNQLLPRLFDSCYPGGRA